MSIVRNSNKFSDSKSFTFRSYGVVIEVSATESRHLELILQKLKSALPKNFEIIENQNVEHCYFIESKNDDWLRLFLNGEQVTAGEFETPFFDFLESNIRLRVAEYADAKVFLHAGVVSFNEKAIVIPANSFQGKTTLVKELIQHGAKYYSDEYAVLDEKGCVHPFPKTLSVRETTGNSIQTEYSAESFGGVVATKPCLVGMVLITEFRENAVWKPLRLNSGEAVLEMIPHTIPIRHNPRFSLSVLNKVVSRAIICKSLRGEVKTFSKKILEYFVRNT